MRDPKKIDEAREHAYWREQHVHEPYYEARYSYDDYAPAYSTGYAAVVIVGGRSFEEVEDQLEAEYHRRRGDSKLDWPEAKPAVRAAMHRVVERY
jgi:hypothetical protein